MKTVIALAAVAITTVFAGQASAQFGIRIGTRPVVGTHLVIGSVPGVGVSTTRPVSSSKSRLGTNLYGEWTVNANHVTASLDLRRSGYSMDTGQVFESGVWDGDPVGMDQFLLSLESSLRGETLFDATWIIRGRQFRMTSRSSGVSYLVTRNSPTAYTPTPSVPVPGVIYSTGPQASLPTGTGLNFGSSQPIPGSGIQYTPNRTHNGTL